MNKIKKPIIFASVLVLAYTLASQLNIPYTLIFILFLLANAAFIWMVVKILKSGEPSDKSFDDYFYEDREDLRRSG